MVGIYKITNRHNGKVYIGQSNDIERRKEQHFGALNKGKHENRTMQLDYNMYSSDFAFEVLEECYLSRLNERERYWINYFNSTDKRYGYNNTKGGGIRRRKNKDGRPTCLLEEILNSKS